MQTNIIFYVWTPWLVFCIDDSKISAVVILDRKNKDEPTMQAGKILNLSVFAKILANTRTSFQPFNLCWYSITTRVTIF